MASKNERLKETDQKEGPVKETVLKKAVPEAVYTMDEFVHAAQEVFPGIRRECVMAAFKVAGIKKATVKEAKKMVNDFCKKEVR